MPDSPPRPPPTEGEEHPVQGNNEASSSSSASSSSMPLHRVTQRQRLNDGTYKDVSPQHTQHQDEDRPRSAPSSPPASASASASTSGPSPPRQRQPPLSSSAWSSLQDRLPPSVPQRAPQQTSPNQALPFFPVLGSSRTSTSAESAANGSSASSTPRRAFLPLPRRMLPPGLGLPAPPPHFTQQAAAGSGPTDIFSRPSAGGGGPIPSIPSLGRSSQEGLRPPLILPAPSTVIPTPRGLLPAPGSTLAALLTDILGIGSRRAATGVREANHDVAPTPPTPLGGTQIVVQGAMISRPLPGAAAGAAPGPTPQTTAESSTGPQPASASAESSGSAQNTNSFADQAGPSTSAEGDTTRSGGETDDGSAETSRGTMLATMDEQANMLTRLLSIAAAATAASLILNGSQRTPTDGSAQQTSAAATAGQSTTAPATMQAPSSSSRPAQRDSDRPFLLPGLRVPRSFSSIASRFRNWTSRRGSSHAARSPTPSTSSQSARQPGTEEEAEVERHIGSSSSTTQPVPERVASMAQRHPEMTLSEMIHEAIREESRRHENAGGEGDAEQAGEAEEEGREATEEELTATATAAAEAAADGARDEDRMDTDPPTAPAATAEPDSEADAQPQPATAPTLPEHLQNVLRSVRENRLHPGSEGSFERWLTDLGGDLVSAVRGMHGGSEAASTSSATQAASASATSSTTASGPTTTAPAGQQSTDPSPPTPAPAPAAESADTIQPSLLPSSGLEERRREWQQAARRAADVESGNLSFFRLFRFDEATDASQRRTDTAAAGSGSSDAGAHEGSNAAEGQGQRDGTAAPLVPTVVVGVRSNFTPPAGAAQAAAQDGVNGTTQPETAQSQPPQSTNDANTTSAPGAPSGSPPSNPLPTPGSAPRFLLFVSGGHYSPSHPLLSAPRSLAAREFLMLMEVLANINGGGAGMGPGGKAKDTISKEELEKHAAGVRSWSEIKEKSVGQDAEPGATTTTSAAASSPSSTSMKETPTLALRAGDRCGICLEEWADEDRCRVLEGCRHVYHQGCVDEWLMGSSNTCPLCREIGVKIERSPTGQAASGSGG